MVFELFEKRHVQASLAVLLSTIFAPMAEAHWSLMILEIFDHEWYFVWGSYSLHRNQLILYGSNSSNPYMTLGLLNLMLLWAVCGIVLSVIILYTSRTDHRPLFAWIVAASVLVAQILLPISVFGALTGDTAWDLRAITIYHLPLPIPSILTLVYLSSQLLLMRTKTMIESTVPTST
jgi:hypothetical protein